MKNLLSIVIVICFMTSCAPKVVQLTDGRMITKKKETRMIHKAMKTAYKSLSKDQKQLLFEDVNITVDTLHVSGN